MNSIRGRILLPLAIFMVVLPVCTYVSFGVVTRRYMREMAYEDLTSSLSATRVIVENVYGEYGDSGVDLTEDQKRERAKEILLRTRQALRQGQNQVTASIIVLNRGYNMLFPSEPDQEAAAIAAYFNDRKDVQRLDEDPPVFEEIHTQGKNYIACLLRITDPDKVLSNYLIVYSSIDSADSLLSLAAQFTLGITALLSLAALVVAWLAATSIAAPIRRLCGHLASIGEGRFASACQSSRVKEVRSLIQATDRMTSRLARYDKAQKTFFQNASHELRTPLMSIQGYAEGIRYGVFSDPNEAADIIAAESRRLTGLVDGLLTLSRLDNDQQSMDIERIDLAAFLHNTMERLKGMAIKERIQLEVLPGPQVCHIAADEQLLTKSVQNVLSNAIRYAASRVTARIRQEPGAVRLYIADDGPGIPPQDVERVFDRFFTGARGQCGIGLSVARSSMEYMGGGIRVAEGEQGAVFELTFQPDENSSH